MSSDEEANLIDEAEKAKERLRAGMKKARSVVQDYRAKLAKPEKPLFRFKKGDADR
jgi:uncharacterized protein (UPF0254 family)